MGTGVASVPDEKSCGSGSVMNESIVSTHLVHREESTQISAVADSQAHCLSA